MLHAVIAVVALPVLLYIFEWIKEWHFYRDQKKHNCSAPYALYSALGLKSTLEFEKNYRNHNMHPYVQSQMEGAMLPDGFKIRTARVQIISRMVFFTYDPENVKAVLATQFKDFDLGSRYDAFQPLLGDGIFTLSGAGWQHSRALLRPQFTNEQVSRLHDVEKSCQELIDVLRESHHSGEYIDIQEQFFRLTLDTATEFLFGESVNCLADGKRLDPAQRERATKFAKAFTTGQSWLLYRVLAQKFYWLVNGTSFFRSNRICHDFVDYYVDKALKETEGEKATESSDGRYVFLKDLTKETRDPTVMRDQALNILLAGRDTTAGLLSFTFALLLRHKKVWYKLREAVLNDFGTTTDTIDFHTLKRCEYLKWVINEVLRLYPQVPINFRQATRDTTLPTGGGPQCDQPIFVRKGTIVFYHTYTMQRHEGFWGANGNEFDPERWANIKGSDISWKYIPFNGGPRICIGQQFALTEAAYVITRLCQSFEDISGLAEDIGKPIKEKSTLTLSVAGGVPINLVPAKA